MQQAPGQNPQTPPEGGRGTGAAGQAGGRGGAAGQQAGGRGGRGGTPAPTIPPEFNADAIMKMDQPALLAILNNRSSTFFQKAISCKRLAVIGKRESIAPLAALLSDARLGHYGRFGLEPNPDPAVDDALRSAIPKLKGRLLMGVIHTIGVRKDARAVDALGRLMNDADPEIAQAAAASLGAIGGLAAAKLLRDGLTRTKVPVMPVVARAALQCADGLMASNRAQALEMYNTLTGATMPRVVRQAAFRALNAAATTAAARA